MGGPSTTNSHAPVNSAQLTTYYVGWFTILAILVIIARRITATSEEEHNKAQVVTAKFKKFQLNYIVVYLVMMAADWLQGPYVYALYSYYGFSISEIGQLFIFGFGSSLVFGCFAGSMADKYGRKRMCLVFGVLYSISCMTKHFPDFKILVFGRLLGGISTSILFSAFESWMVHEHHESNYPDDWLGLTFSACTSGNGLVAISSGVFASFLNSNFGPVAPFDASLLLLIIGSMIIFTTWNENVGDSHVDITTTIGNAVTKLKEDKKIWLLGFIQSFFEGAMYIFVFMWTPSLESSASPDPILHGWCFASFMLCVLIGSAIFKFFSNMNIPVETSSMYLFAVSSVALIVPAFFTDLNVRLISFFVFEVCVGMFWPSLGVLRSRYVPEEVRATTMNIFRIPLNLLVVLVLSDISSLGELVYYYCFLLLILALFCQFQLHNIYIQSQIAPPSMQDIRVSSSTSTRRNQADAAEEHEIVPLTRDSESN